MASKVAVVNLSGSLNAKNRDFARLSSPLGGQTPPRRPYRRIGEPQEPQPRGGRNIGDQLPEPGLHESHLLGESDPDSSQRIVSIRCESRESKGFGEKSRN